MALVAVLFLGEDGNDLIVGGITVLERQRRLAQRAKADHIIVVGAIGVDSATSQQAASAQLVQLVADDDAVLMMAPGVVADERIIDHLLQHAAPAMACWPSGETPQRGVERIDANHFSAGLALYRGATLRQVVGEIGDWDMQSTLLRMSLNEPGMTLLELAALDQYAPARRRNVPFTWVIPDTLGSARVATDLVIAGSQKGCLDWPAALIHPPIEDALVRILAPTRITPNMVTLFVALIGIVAAVAFACGWMWTGLALALISGPLDGVDGKLARTRIEYSRFGDLEHVLDKICEYAWYMCIAAHLAVLQTHSGPWAIAALIILFALAESVQGEFYRRFTGAQLDDAGGFERRFRFVSGRRNTFFWSYLPFAAAGAWYAGFVMIAAYSAITFFVMQFRLFVRLQEFGSAQSTRIAANFARTAYAFLPSPKGSAR